MRSFFFVWEVLWGGGRGGRYVFYGFNEVAQCQIGWNTEDGLFLRGEERSILLEVMKSNILERGGLWDVICLGG